MLRSEAARYARWSASVALVLAVFTLFVYLQRGWVRHEEKKKAPPPAPIEVSRQSHSITFKKQEQNQTIFEVTASRSTEFKGENSSLLENVAITIFGKAGERHDVIQTKSCQYGRENGGIICSGQVQITLMTARDALRATSDPAAKAAVTHLETRGVVFDRATGLAQTDQRVTFEFPSGHGDGQGLEYRSEQGSLLLKHNVHLTLVPTPPKAASRNPVRSRSAQEIHMEGGQLEFSRDTRILHLLGPVEAQMSTQHLTAGKLTLLMDKEFRAEKLSATAENSARPTVTNQQPNNRMSLEADTLTAYFSPEGFVTRVEAQGAAHCTRAIPLGQEEANAGFASLDFWPSLSQLKELNLKDKVALSTQSTKSAESRVLETSALRMQFSGGEAGAVNKPRMAETLARGTMEWTELVQPGATSVKTKLQADKLEMEFTAQDGPGSSGKPSLAGKPRLLTANGNVQTERTLPGHPIQTVTARNGVIELQPSGGWSQMNLQGDVKLKEGDHMGEAEHALFVRASQTAVLTGSAVARDATTQTHAPKITFLQANGDIRAEGGVRSTDLPAPSSAAQRAPAPANITAQTLQANSKTGRALYTGHARLWQGDYVLEADSIELLRETRVLNAAGNVRAVFPQAPSKADGAGAEPRTQDSSRPNVAPVRDSQTPTKKPELWQVSSGTLTYRDLENRAHLEKNVVVLSPEQRMRCPILELYFTRNEQGGQKGSNSASSGTAANSLVGSQQISRAVGSGGVTVEEGQRKATAERGEYVAELGKFVMTGGNPTLYDGSEGTTTGRQLTFFLADDTIIVDSENGSRTLTKHRVEK